MTPIKTLYDEPYRSSTCWLDNRDLVLVGPEIIDETIKIVDLIKKRMKEAQDSKKSYADLHRRNFEFDLGDHVFLKINQSER